MSQLHDKKIIISAAPISGPGKEASYQAGRQAGEEDRAAGLVKAGDQVTVSQVRRLLPQYRTDHDLIGGLTLRGTAGPLAQAHAGHETASHRLHQANTEVNETGLNTLGSIQERDATASHIISLVNPELVRPGPARRETDAAASDPAASPGAVDAAPPSAFRHIIERRLPKNVGWVVLAALAAAEGFLNIQAFAATGESSNASFVLAVLASIFHAAEASA